MSATIPDWISAGANVFLAGSIVWGGLIALRRWQVGFRLVLTDGPFHGESVINGVSEPPSVSWFADLTLIHGHIAHVGSYELERWRGFHWKRERGALDAQTHLPASIGVGETVKVWLTTKREDNAPMRLRIREYRSLRTLVVPFLPAKR